MSEVKQEPGVFAKRIAEQGKQIETLTAEVKILRTALVIIAQCVEGGGHMTITVAAQLERLIGDAGKRGTG